MEGPIAQRALYQEVAERLRALIYAGDLAPGARVDELELAARFHISRTPMREALKVLHAEGLVRLTPRRGAFVTGELTAADLDDLFPLIALLEGLCAREAVRKAGPAGLRRLEALHEELERHAAAGDVDRYYEWNQAFHAAVQELAANRWLSRSVSDLRNVLRLLRGRQLRLRGRLRASLAEHRALMKAIRRRDAAAAERVMRDHLMAQRAALAAFDRAGEAAARAAERRATSTGVRDRPEAAASRSRRGTGGIRPAPPKRTPGA